MTVLDWRGPEFLVFYLILLLVSTGLAIVLRWFFRGPSDVPPFVKSIDAYHEVDLANSPMPAYELLDISRYNRLTVQTSRGCPWRCAFCASSILLTAKYKQKPIPMVLAEIDRIRDIWRRPFIEFADDTAFVRREWWRQFLPELAKRRVK